MKNIRFYISIAFFILYFPFNYPLNGQNKLNLDSWRLNTFERFEVLVDSLKIIDRQTESAAKRKWEIVNQIDHDETYKLFQIAKKMNPIKHWGKMYIIYHFFDNTDPIYSKTTVVFSSSTKNWGLSKDDTMGDFYYKTYRNNKVNIWEAFKAIGGQNFIGYGLMVTGEFDNQYNLIRNEVYLNTQNNRKKFPFIVFYNFKPLKKNRILRNTPVN